MDTLNGSSITTKVVSIVVAIVVFSMVLVPVVNGLADGNGNGGESGSGGGSGESEKVLLNTFESSLGDDLTPYKSYQIYTPATTPTLPNEITYTLEDLNEIMSIWTSGSEEVSAYVTILEAYDDSRTGVRVTYDGSNIGVTIMNNGSGGGQIIPYLTSFNLTISTDYQLDCSYTVVFPAGSTPRTESIQTTVIEVKQLSESEDGWVNMSWDLHNDKISAGSKVMLWGYIDSLEKGWSKTIVITKNMVSNNHLKFTIDWGEGYTSDVDLELQSTDMAGVWKFTDAFYDWNGTIKDSNGVELDPDDAYCEVEFFSTYGYPQSSSGSATLNNPEPYSLRYKYASGTIPDFSIDYTAPSGSDAYVITTSDGEIQVDSSKEAVSYVVFASNEAVYSFSRGFVYFTHNGDMYGVISASLKCVGGQLSLVPANNGIFDIKQNAPVSEPISLGTVDWCYYASPLGEYGNYIDAQIEDGLYYDSTKPVYSYGVCDDGMVFKNFEAVIANQPSVESVTSTITTSGKLYTGTTWTGGTLAEDNPVINYWTILPTSIDNGSNGSGTGSNTGISGSAGTIIKTIPLFVGIGLILAIVSMFYDPKNLIGGQE